MQDSSPRRRLTEVRPLAAHNPLARPSPRSHGATERSSMLDAALRQQRPVICAVDRDDLAAGVLATAAVLAAELAVPLTVIHSPDPDVFLFGEPRRTALERGSKFVDELVDGYTVDERVVELDDSARLVTAVAEGGASMIIIGTRGRTGLRAALWGSVSRAVISSAACPVLTIPSAAARTNKDRSDDRRHSPTASGPLAIRPRPDGCEHPLEAAGKA
jgi:nucleotide-binding universal stress UspA family protein